MSWIETYRKMGHIVREPTTKGSFKTLLGVLALLLGLALMTWGVYLLELNGWRF